MHPAVVGTAKRWEKSRLIEESRISPPFGRSGYIENTSPDARIAMEAMMKATNHCYDAGSATARSVARWPSESHASLAQCFT
jgi:hypothetical protein